MLRIVHADWPALFAAMAIPMVVAITVVHPILFRPADPRETLLLVFGLPATATLAGVLCWRVWRVMRLFDRGVSVPGRITRIQLVKDRGRVAFAYRVRGNEHHCWQPVHQNARVRALLHGQAIQVLVDPEKPGLAIIEDLFDSR